MLTIQKLHPNPFSNQQPQHQEPQRLSGIYQYHNAPEVLPEHGLEYDDNTYPVSDKYPVTSMDDYPASFNAQQYRNNNNKPPRIIFGMKVRSFLLVALVFVLIVVGAVVGGTVGRNASHAANATAVVNEQSSRGPHNRRLRTNHNIGDICHNNNSRIYNSTINTNLVLGFHNWHSGVPKIAGELKKNPAPLRLGVLGAAAINPGAIFDPVSRHPDVVIAGIASRSKAKAEQQIKVCSLPVARAYGSYEDLLSDPKIEAVYISLPNGLHFDWTIKSLRQGKHVLVEKPIASNAAQAQEIANVSQETGKVVLEAFHWRFHPAAHLCKQLVASGEYGKVKEVTTKMALPAAFLSKDDIRFNYDLAGGSCMDLTYVFSATSYYATSSLAEAKIEVIEATARTNKKDPLVDEAMQTTYTVTSNGNTVTCHTQCDLAAPWLWGIIPPFWDLTAGITFTCENASIHYTNFPGPYLNHSINVRDNATGVTTKHQALVDGPQWLNRGEKWWTTYRYQLEAFVDRVRGVQSGNSVAEAEELDGLPWVSMQDSIAVMGIIDKVYEKAGLPLRK
ncbi:unnamed protein product [Aureobasidium vineae]|uniref:D-xylose 1-dehydrogenase (NADP(+), D-xylono-1,5-lactone-forming) n=1 Tax=Aureobasidium vineae TaxID=2773715 RepID=A0A9N8PAW0_9PEZI|nr:unnamed protein product [Aureobasidium vineae]